MPTHTKKGGTRTTCRQVPTKKRVISDESIKASLMRKGGYQLDLEVKDMCKKTREWESLVRETHK